MGITFNLLFIVCLINHIYHPDLKFKGSVKSNQAAAFTLLHGTHRFLFIFDLLQAEVSLSSL